MSLCAIIPVAQMIAANDALEADGFGPENFSVPSFTGANASHGSLHSWNDAAFEAAVIALPGVVFDVGDGDPITRTNDLIVGQGSQWGAQAPPLPTTGDAIAGTLYSYGDGELWSCIQTFDRTTFPLPPSNYPALIRQARIPGTAIPWKQPIDQFDAYLLPNAFTGEGDQCTHNGSTWVTLVNVNVWEPGAVGSETLWAVVP